MMIIITDCMYYMYCMYYRYCMYYMWMNTNPFRLKMDLFLETSDFHRQETQALICTAWSITSCTKGSNSCSNWAQAGYSVCFM